MRVNPTRLVLGRHMLAASYEDLLLEVREKGYLKDDRTHTGMYAKFVRTLRYDLATFPLITTKKVNFNWIVVELIWFLKGDTHIRYLLEHGVSIWSEWPYKTYLTDNGLPIPDINSKEWTKGLREFEQRILDDDEFSERYGDLGPVYGAQWRSWPAPDGRHIDQLTNVINEIKRNPNSRRLVVSAWNVADLDEMELPPCHALFQFYVEDGKLSCALTQRSADLFLGVPFNIASYALLTMLVAKECGLEPGEFIWTGNVVHLYANHVDQADLQLTREGFEFPTVEIDEGISLYDYTPGDIRVVGYQHHPYIWAPIAV